MTSPLVRAWLAARLPDWADHAYACWRGLLHALGISTEWDPLELGEEYTAVRVPAGTDPLDLPLLRVCERASGGCGAHVGAPCVTGRGHVTRPHKPRREVQS